MTTPSDIAGSFFTFFVPGNDICHWLGVPTCQHLIYHLQHISENVSSVPSVCVLGIMLQVFAYLVQAIE
ncbi:hypothetical protein HVW63_14295 [Citrobacter freundii]|uniref:hypothetical protein n=1 Tax=Citrobacter portucalensis TaxID=1639133 RepID=UPI0015E9FC35|nr:hypothetical protein HVW63_14295 [Citrobacter freundii]